MLILGGYGNFGARIAENLARHGVPVTIAGRSEQKAGVLANRLSSRYGTGIAGAAVLDAEQNLDQYLAAAQPVAVVNTCGPFQARDYRVAESCIRNRIHYIDLADGRGFVGGIAQLDAAARAAGVSVISGASTVPALSSAVVEHYRHEFAEIDELVFGISPGQKADRGLATTEAILGYIGKPLRPAAGDAVPRYGWQDLHRERYPEIGSRWMANCDIPDLDLLPLRYGIRRIRFSAGMESGFLHLGMFALGWLVRLGLPLRLEKHARFLLRASHWFDALGTDAGGMHLFMRGRDRRGAAHERKWFIIAKHGDGPQIPCVPAIVLARRLAQGAPLPKGAYPCLGIVSLAEYLQELNGRSIRTYEA